jgi:hypothetical protein
MGLADKRKKTISGTCKKINAQIFCQIFLQKCHWIFILRQPSFIDFFVAKKLQQNTAFFLQSKDVLSVFSNAIKDTIKV